MNDLITQSIAKVLRSAAWRFSEDEIPDFLTDVKAELAKVDLEAEAKKIMDAQRLEKRRLQTKRATDKYRAKKQQGFRADLLAEIEKEIKP